MKRTFDVLFSLDWPVTENQIINTKCQSEFFVVFSIWKRKRADWPTICFFVSGRSNEKDNLILTLIDNNQQFLLNFKEVSCKLSCAFHFQELFIFRLLFALYNQTLRLAGLANWQWLLLGARYYRRLPCRLQSASLRFMKPTGLFRMLLQALQCTAVLSPVSNKPTKPARCVV